jgi:hypothetical protein
MFRPYRRTTRRPDRPGPQRRHRVTYANVAATLALVLALGAGTAYASHYLITSTSQIKPGVIKKLRGDKGKTGAKGAIGPAGVTGATGATGAQGFARDAGAVAPSSEGGPSFETGGLIGWRSVTSSSTGEYCLTPDATSTTGNTTLLVSPGNGAGSQVGYAFWDGYCDHAGDLGLQVTTTDLSGTAQNDIGFVAVVPNE